MVSAELLLHTLGTVGAKSHADTVAALLCDSGFEDNVPISSLVKLLRDAGVSPVRAIVAKNAVKQKVKSLVRGCTVVLSAVLLYR